MNDTLKRDSIIVVSGVVILYFLLRKKNTSVISSVANASPDTSTPLSIPQFNPKDYFTGGANVSNLSAHDLSDKYIPLFGFIVGSGVSLKSNTIQPLNNTLTNANSSMFVTKYN